MFFKKDNLSKFNFISTGDFLFAFLFMFLATAFSYLFLPILLEKAFPKLSNFFNSHSFITIIFFISSILSFYIIYYYSCASKLKTLKEGLFLYKKSFRTYLLSFVFGIVMPLITLPIIFKFAPGEFYAMDIIKTKGGMTYLFISALFAPIFEEIFYRGFIFPFFQSKLNSFWAIVITALFFGFAHFLNVGNAYILLCLFIFYGLVLTLIRYFTNSLIPPIITHFVHNATLITSFLISHSFSGIK